MFVFSYFVGHYEILVFAKFRRSDCSRLHLSVLKFSKFSGGNLPPDSPSFSCLRHSLLVLSRQCYTHIPSYAVPRKNSRRLPGFFNSCFICREKSACDPELGNNFRDVRIFESIMNQLLYFCGAKTRGVYVGMSGAMANSDNEQDFFRRSNKLCRSHGFSWR